MTPLSRSGPWVERIAAALWLALLAGLVVVGAPLLQDRGISSDENTEVQMLLWHLDYAGHALDGSAGDAATELPKDAA